MKILVGGLGALLGTWASVAAAEQTIVVNGNEYPLSALMMTCQAIEDQSEQVECFGNISRLLGEQSAEVTEDAISVPEALDALRAAAQYRNDETGLLIGGTDCNVSILFYGNYFHVSRRNISEIDALSVSFDASQVLRERTTGAGNRRAGMTWGSMNDGAAAKISGGIGLDSSQHGFAPRSPGATVEEFATTVVGQLPAMAAQEFDFVLVHPLMSEKGAEIWETFDTFVGACTDQGGSPNVS